MITSDDPPHIIVLDAGPIIGSINSRDARHETSVVGFRQLRAARSRMLIPLPVLFEVYKRLAYTVGLDPAQHALDVMRDTYEIVYVGADEFERLYALMGSIPWWRGSLEDATLAMLAAELRVPLWTYNYRDLTAFRDIEFWTPG